MEVENQNKTDGSGFLRAAQSAGVENYLGDHETVDRLVRDFASSVIDRFQKVAGGNLTPNDAAEADRKLCLHMADVFLGRAPGYAPVEHWSQDGLAGYIRNKCADTIQPEDDQSVVAQAFAMLAHVIYEQIRTGADDRAMGAAIDEGIRSLTMLLLGVGEHDN